MDGLSSAFLLKVKGLIPARIGKSESKTESNATEKAFYDKELEETNTKKADNTAEVDKLSTNNGSKNDNSFSSIERQKT